MKLLTIRAVLLGFAVTYLTETVRADAPPTCAVLVDQAGDLKDSAVVALLEKQLSADRRVRLVERGTIDEVFKEQELKFMFSADAVVERSRLGNLLEADLLIALREVDEAGKAAINVVICETNGGLRLHTSAISLSDEPEEDAGAVAALLDEALRRYAAEHRIVVAVPPFAGSDFRHEHDRLRSTYARMVEQALVVSSQITVVEFAEAQAIAKELSRAGDGAGATRDQPVYVLGEYGSVQWTEAKCNLVLTARRAGETIKSVKAENVSADQVISSLQTMAASLRDVITGHGSKTGPNPEQEIAQLEERARLFERGRNYAEAVVLMQAALVLQPQNGALHLEVARLCTQTMSQLARDHFWMAREVSGQTTVEDYVERSTLALHYFTSSIEHLEKGLLLCDLRKTDPQRVSEANSGNWNWYKDGAMHAIEAAVQKRLKELSEEQREMLFRVLETKARAGEINCHIAHAFFEVLGARFGIQGSEPRRWRFFEIVQDVPGFEDEILRNVLKSAVHLPCHSEPVELTQNLLEELRTPAMGETLARLENLPGCSTRKAATTLKALMLRSFNYRLRVIDEALSDLHGEMDRSHHSMMWVPEIMTTFFRKL